MDWHRFASILVIKPSSLGDLVHALPAVSLLRQALPQAPLRWLVNTEWMPLLQNHPLVDEVVEFPRRSFRGGGMLTVLPDWLSQWRASRPQKPELIVDLQGLLRSGLLARLRKTSQSHCIGLSDAREGAAWCYDQTLQVDAREHAVRRYLTVASALGQTWEESTLTFPLPQQSLPEGWPTAPVIAVHPYARGAGKALQPEALQALLQALAPHRVVILGVSADRLQNLPGHVEDWTGRTNLAQLIACLRAAQAVISVDSGPMHLAAALNPRVLGLHTWTDPRKVGPFPTQAWVWKAGQIARWRELAPEVCQSSANIEPAAAELIGTWVKRWLVETA